MRRRLIPVLLALAAPPPAAALRSRPTPQVVPLPVAAAEGGTSRDPLALGVIAGLQPGEGARAHPLGTGVKPLGTWFDHVGNFTPDGKAGDYTGVTKNGENDLHAIIISVAFSSVAGLGCVSLFLLLRRALPAVFSARTEPELEEYDPDLEPPGGCLCSWGQVAASIPDEKVIKIAGLDGLMLGEFFFLCQHVLSIIGPCIVLVLCPLHYRLGTQYRWVNGQRVQLDFLSRLGVEAMTSAWDEHVWNTLTERERLNNTILCFVHVAVVWFVAWVTIWMIYRAQYRFLEHRIKWLQEIPVPRATTLMVEEIPEELRSDDALFAYFAKLFSEESISRAYIVRRTGKLRRLVSKVEDLTAQLAGAQERCDAVASGRRSQHADSLGEEVEAIAGIERQLEEARAAVETERQWVEQRVPLREAAICSSSGFVTFASRRWCRLASREQLKTNAAQLVMSMPPDPSDVRYGDLARDPALQQSTNVLARLLTLLVFCTWLPITVFISGFTSLDALQRFPATAWLKPLCQYSPLLKLFLEGLLAQIALKVVLALLPSILIAIIHNFMTLKGGASTQLKLQDRYFWFLVIFVVLVSAINVALLRSLEELVLNPSMIFQLGNQLPASSHFYIQYLVLGCFTATMALLRPFTLLKYLMYKTARMSPAEARRRSEPEDQDSDGMGARMANGTLMMTVSIVFCTCSPVIALFGFAYFAIASRVYRWLKIYAETKKPDLGGAFWVLSLRHIFYALGIYVVLETGVLANAPSVWGSGRWQKLPALCVLACGPAIMLSRTQFNKIVWESLPFEAVAETDHGARGEEDRFGEYVQSECLPGAALRGEMPAKDDEVGEPFAEQRATIESSAK